MSNEELLALANYSPGMCLCGHGESCAVCMRSEQTRKQESNSRDLALAELKRRGLKPKLVKSHSPYTNDTWTL
jgi:hypothetical protein